MFQAMELHRILPLEFRNNSCGVACKKTVYQLVRVAYKNSAMIEKTEEPAKTNSGQRPPPALDGTPGKLTSELSLRLHTHQATHLFHGRRAKKNRSSIIGLVGFGRLCDVIRDLDAIEKIDDQLRDAAERLTQMKHQVDKNGEAIHLDVSDHRSDWPQKVSLAFRTPTANRGAQLLGQYDDVIIESHKNFMLGIYNRREFRARVKLAG